MYLACYPRRHSALPLDKNSILRRSSTLFIDNSLPKAQDSTITSTQLLLTLKYEETEQLCFGNRRIHFLWMTPSTTKIHNYVVLQSKLHEKQFDYGTFFY